MSRPPAVAREAMVATSQPLATRAGVRALERGGNAADAALAAAGVLCVTQPMSTGIGGDCFAQIYRDGKLEGLDAAGPAPANADPVTPVEQFGPRSVTVPGAVAGWGTLVDALEALGLLARSSPSLSDQIRSAQLALEDALELVRDGADVSGLITPEHLDARAGSPSVAEPAGGTVYLCAVDGEGMAVSFIQSLYEGFGSGMVAPGTGIVLQNRGGCFSVSGAVEPGRRPYHTIIPGMLLRDGRLLGPFGVMGGFIQAQAHMQIVSRLVDDGLDPQAALDRPRFRVEDDRVHLEEGLWDRADELEAEGFRVVCERDTAVFGGGQAILVSEDGLAGGSDRRLDGF